MKPTKFCDCISCTDCKYYFECMKYEIETEQVKVKFSFGTLKKYRFSGANDLKD